LLGVEPALFWRKVSVVRFAADGAFPFSGLLPVVGNALLLAMLLVLVDVDAFAGDDFSLRHFEL
jgi:hypothetical protein